MVEPKLGAPMQENIAKYVEKSETLWGWLWTNVIDTCKVWWSNEIRGALNKKTKLQIPLKQCTYILTNFEYLFLYKAPQKSFEHQTFQASITFVYNHPHKVSIFFKYFAMFSCEGAPSWGVGKPLSRGAYPLVALHKELTGLE